MMADRKDEEQWEEAEVAEDSETLQTILMHSETGLYTSFHVKHYWQMSKNVFRSSGKLIFLCFLFINNGKY